MFVTSNPSALARRPRALAMGTFDGVHAGHRAVLRRAKLAGLIPTVLTFDPHPRQVLGRDVPLISTLPRRLELLAATGIEDALVVHFTKAMSAMAPEDWVERFVRPLGTRRIIVGENFRFGHRAAGNAETLRQLGFQVDALPLSCAASSTRIRELVGDGQLVEARRLLGRPFELEGFAEPSRTAGRHVLRPLAGTVLPPCGSYDGSVLGRSAWVTVKKGNIHVEADVGVLARAGTPVRVELRREHRGPVGSKRWTPGPIVPLESRAG